jgi:hypothetical protein
MCEVMNLVIPLGFDRVVSAEKSPHPFGDLTVIIGRQDDLILGLLRKTCSSDLARRIPGAIKPLNTSIGVVDIFGDDINEIDDLCVDI